MQWNDFVLFSFTDLYISFGDKCLSTIYVFDKSLSSIYICKQLFRGPYQTFPIK